MNRYDLNHEQINRILAQANKIGFVDILPILIYDIMRVEGQLAGTSVLFMLAPLLTAMGLLLHQSSVQPFEHSRQGICNFSALIAHPSTGKTPALNVIKAAIMKIETYNKVPHEKSRLTNSASIEGLLEHLNNIPCMAAFYDESNTFLGQLARYGGGASAALYERSIYLSLFSAVDSLDRDLKSERIKIIMPRFHMCLLGHPYFFINLLKQERFSYDDGLFQRFFLISPTPPTITAEEIRSTPKTILAIHCIFYFIDNVHANEKRNYTYTEDALKLIDIEFNLARKRVTIANEFDSYIAAMCGKILTHLVRISMMLQALTTATTTLLGLPDSTERNLTDTFVRECNKTIENLPSSAFIITADIVSRSKRLVDFFNMNKLILSSYSVEPTSSFDEAFDKICEGRPRLTTISAHFSTFSSKSLRFMRKAFEVTFSKFNASKLSSNNLSVEEAIEIFTCLANHELGIITLEKNNKNNLTVTYFTRTTAENIRTSSSLGQTILDMGLNLTTVLELLDETEARENSEVTKRLRDLDEELIDQPAPKRQKIRQSLVTNSTVKRKDNSLPYTQKATQYIDTYIGRDNDNESDNADEAHINISSQINSQKKHYKKSNEGQATLKHNTDKNSRSTSPIYMYSPNSRNSRSSSQTSNENYNNKQNNQRLNTVRISKQPHENSPDSGSEYATDSGVSSKRSSLDSNKNTSDKSDHYKTSHNSSDDQQEHTGSDSEYTKKTKESTNKILSSQLKSSQQKASLSRIESAQITKTKKSNVYEFETQSDTDFDKSGTAKKTQPGKNGRYGKRGPYKKKQKVLAKTNEVESEDDSSISENIESFQSDSNDKPTTSKAKPPKHRKSKSPDGNDVTQRQKTTLRTKNFTPPALPEPSSQLNTRHSSNINAKLRKSNDM